MPFTTTGPLGAFGSDGFGSTPYGSAVPAFGVAAVRSLNSVQVRVTFTDLIDFSYSAILNPANYSFDNGLSALLVAIDSAQSVRITTSAQSEISYELVVASGRSLSGALIDPALDTGSFVGIMATRSFAAVAVAPATVRLLFGSPLTTNAALTTAGSYTITDLNGVPVPVLSARTEVLTHPTTVVLTLDSALTPTQGYQVTVDSAVLTEAGAIVTPSTEPFMWIEPTKNFTFPIRDFAGEIRGGLLGNHNGLVFFSPALDAPVANSIIQVDTVDVCTTAYDTYTPPQLIDPSPLFTYSPQGPSSLLGPSAVLFARWNRLVEAQVNVSDLRADTLPLALSSGATGTLTETWDITKVSLLNSPGWKTFDNTSEPPLYFKTADNTAPIPAGATSVVVLEP